jgi:uncharacterized protein YjgD (DUF1641 family)
MQAELELEQLNQKIDALTEQVAYLAEQARAAQMERQSRDDLLDTVNPVMKEALNLAAVEMADLPPSLGIPDLLRLLTKLIRHAPQMEALLDLADSAADLVQTLGPIPLEALTKVTAVLADLETKGYFRLADSGARTLDALVGELDPQALAQLPEQVHPLVSGLKQAVQPGDLDMLFAVARSARAELDQPIDSSLTGLMRQLRDPEVRRGLAVSLALLRAIGKQAAGQKTAGK